MSDEIIKLLDDLGQRFGIVIDWSSENVMPYIQGLISRYVNYEVMTSVVWIVISLVALIGCSIGVSAINKHANKILKERPYSDWKIGKWLVIWIFIITIGCFIICIICQTLDIVTCYTIPEKIIFEYLNSLLSANG